MYIVNIIDECLEVEAFTVDGSMADAAKMAVDTYLDYSPEDLKNVRVYSTADKDIRDGVLSKVLALVDRLGQTDELQKRLDVDLRVILTKVIHEILGVCPGEFESDDPTLTFLDEPSPNDGQIILLRVSLD